MFDDPKMYFQAFERPLEQSTVNFNEEVTFVKGYFQSGSDNWVVDANDDHDSQGNCSYELKMNKPLLACIPATVKFHHGHRRLHLRVVDEMDIAPKMPEEKAFLGRRQVFRILNEDMKADYAKDGSIMIALEELPLYEGQLYKIPLSFSSYSTGNKGWTFIGQVVDEIGNVIEELTTIRIHVKVEFRNNQRKRNRLSSPNIDGPRSPKRVKEQVQEIRFIELLEKYETRIKALENKVNFLESKLEAAKTTIPDNFQEIPPTQYVKTGVPELEEINLNLVTPGC